MQNWVRGEHSQQRTGDVVQLVVRVDAAHAAEALCKRGTGRRFAGAARHADETRLR